METPNNYNVDKLEFRQIVLGHIKKILEISSHELRDTTYTTSHGNYSETTFQEDTRFSYIQAIENLAYILMPYFDEPMYKLYVKYMLVINAYDFQIQKMFIQEVAQICKEIGKEDINLKPYCIDKKIEYAKKLFVELNRLLKRVDYLKNAIYGEEKDEVAQDNEEGEE
jgi:hypothetical protein